MEFSEGLKKVGFGAFSESGVECVNLPSSTKKIDTEAFAECKWLRSVRLNEGLETLGTNEYRENGTMCIGVFQESALESVSLPSTLKRIEYNAFKGCKSLKEV